jgi:hypothetical protein
MWFLFLQVWVLLLISFLSGWVAHWYLCCRNNQKEAGSDTQHSIDSKSPVITPLSTPKDNDLQPDSLAAPRQ